MGQFKTEDQEQLEYIRKWCEMKEEKQRAKEVRKVYVKYHFNMAKRHITECIKLLIGKAV